MIRRLLAIAPVWWLSAALGAIAAVLFFGVVRHYEPIHAPEIAWWALALIVLVTERWPVELEFRRSSHSFSLTDVPLTLALIFASGTHAFAAVILGSVVALLLRRLPPVKFVFNVAQFSFVMTVLLVVVHSAADLDESFGWVTWASVLLATQLGGVLTIAQIIGAIVLTEGRVSGDQVRQMFGMDFVVTVTGTAMALVCSILWIERPSAAPLLAVPILVAFLGYRAYVSERQGHEKVKFLYEANRTLSESPEVADALDGLLERALEAFRAEQAEVILFAADGSAPLRTGLGPGTAREAMAPVDPGSAAALRACAEASDEPVALIDPFPPEIADYLAAREIRHGMLGVLRGEDRVIGTIMLANRFGLARGFTDADRALFETLAANASAALQYDRLEQAVSELRDLQDQLQHQAHHDPLTGLANRALFSQQVREALDPAAGTDVAVMFVDLDDFKGVNDTLGHAVGDELLRGVASRLVRSVRHDDVVARLGGDEFAMLVRRPSDAEQGAIEIAERTLQRLPDAGPRGREADERQPLDRHRRQAARAHARRGAAARRRRRHVRGQGGRQAPLRGLHARDARLDRPPSRPQGRAAARDRRARADRAVPADRRPQHRRADRGRGARALEPPGPRPHPPGRVHPARRGHRLDRPARALRARGGVHGA